MANSGDPALTTQWQRAKAALGRHDFATAANLCQRMLEQRAEHPPALSMLAYMCEARGDLARTETYLTRLIRAQPRDPRHRVSLGRLHLRQGRVGEALVQAEKAGKLDPRDAAALALKANVHEIRNEYDRARRTLAPMLRRDPVPLEVAVVQMRLLVHDRSWDEAIALGRRVTAAGHPDGEPLRDVLFELARAQERAGEHAAAFATAQRANAILAARFDPDAYDAFVDRIITTFDADRLRTMPRATIPTDAAIFIVGMPRTGSTLVERILASHSAVRGVGEHPALQRLLRALPASIGSTRPYPECIADLSGDDADALARQYLETIAALAPGAQRIVNKHLPNALHVGVIAAAFPGASVIDCRRDPVDTCLSCYMERLRPTSVPFASDLTSLARVYRASRRLMDHWDTVLERPTLHVDYEKLVEDQAGQSRRIVEHCDLPWEDALLRFHESKDQQRTLSFDQVRQPIYRSSMGRAARFGALLDPLRAALGDAVAADGGRSTHRP